MDSTDDDFGELYVDEKAHATAAFAGDVGCEEPESSPVSGDNKGFEVTVKPESRGEAKKLDVMEVDKGSSTCVDDDCAVNRTEAKEESEYSDSDDDLNIVLKEDDSKALLPVACGSDTNDRKRSGGNWCTMPNSGMVNGRMTMEAYAANNAWMNPSLGMPQCGYNLSHTWSRTAFDVNFHGFEKKPWRNPGMDVNDFFNFGLNEQSWKDYCNPLVKGRAIEVEGGTLGRTPSVDLRYPRDLDPDVVIQIPVTNDVEELSSMTPVEARSLSKQSNRASRSEEFHSDIGEDLHSSGSMKEEVSVGCEDKNTGNFRDEQSPPKENYYSREVTPCDKEIIEEEKQETCWSSDKANSSSVEREPSLGDHFRFSPTSSYSVGKTEESEDSGTESSKDGATDDQCEASTPPRRTRFAEPEANSTKSGERRGTEHSRHRRSHKDSRKRHYGRADYGLHRRTKYADASPTPDPDLGKKVYSGLYRGSSKNWQNGPRLTLEKVETEGRGFPHSNREKRHGRSYSPVDLDRDRGQRLGWRNNNEPSHGRGFDPSNGQKYEAGLKEYASRSSFSLSQRNSRLSFNKEEDRYGRQHCERRYGRERSPALAYESNKEDRYVRKHCERKYDRERSPRLAYESNKVRNRYDWLGEPYYQECHIPITDMEYRCRFEYSSVTGRHIPKQSRENDLHFRRRCDYDYDFPRGRYEDEVNWEESGMPFEVAYREMHSFAEVGRREFERYEDEFSEIDRRHHYTPGWHHDRFVSENDGHKYRIQDARPSLLSSFRDSWHIKGPRTDSWRDATRDFTKMEAYDWQNNQLYKDAPRDGWPRNLAHSDNVSIQDRLRYDDDRVHRDRRRYQLGDDIHCSEHRSYTDEMLVADMRVSTHSRVSIKERPGYFKSHVHETEERPHRSKKLRRDGHAFTKCQDPVDLTGRQGKLSNQSRRRFPKGGDTTEQQDRQKPRNVVGKRNEKDVVLIQGLNEKEEGEIIQEEEEEERNVTRIQETIKKMEKRRERFKETEVVAAKFHSQTEQEAKTDVTNQTRPVRKRRWCAS